MADSTENSGERSETQEECVNMLYLASTRAPKCNPRELLQENKTGTAIPPADTAQTLPKGTTEVGDKRVKEEQKTVSVTAVKTECAAQSAVISGSQEFGTPDARLDIARQPGDGDSPTDDSESSSRTMKTEPQPQSETDGDAEPEEQDNVNDNVVNDKKTASKIPHKEVERICPRVNCPERIVICMDMSQEMEKVTFRSRAGDKFAPLGLVKRALGIFLRTKHRLNHMHEFALVMLDDAAKWMCEFTNNPDKIMTLLEDVQSTQQAETFDMASVFDEVKQRVPLPRVEDPALNPPPYTVRVLFLYGRSSCVPNFSSRESEKFLQASPHFFLDAFYIHEPPSEENEAEKIFEDICELDSKGLSYVFEVSRNPTKLYDCMAQLLPHPLQRPIQRDSFYSIEPKPEITQ